MPNYLHICKDLEERDLNSMFEYCKECGAKWYMNRRPQVDIVQSGYYYRQKTKR